MTAKEISLPSQCKDRWGYMSLGESMRRPTWFCMVGGAGSPFTMHAYVSDNSPAEAAILDDDLFCLAEIAMNTFGRSLEPVDESRLVKVYE